MSARVATTSPNKHDLLNTPGWKLLKRHARTARRLIRTLKKSKYGHAKASRKYKHGWEVPRDYAHSLELDIQNGNYKWKDAIDLEIEHIKEYQVFKEYGKAVYDKGKIRNAPKGYQKIRVLFLMSDSVENSRQDLWQMDILPKNPWKLSIQELSL